MAKAGRMYKRQVYLPDQQFDTLNKMADSSGLSVAELIRRAIDLFIEQKGVLPRYLTIKEEKVPYNAEKSEP